MTTSQTAGLPGRLLLAAALAIAALPVTLPAPAHAAVGIVLGMGLSYQKYEACEQAKTDAQGKATIAAMSAPGGSANLQITKVACQCEETPTNPANIRWKCMAETHWSTER